MRGEPFFLDTAGPEDVPALLALERQSFTQPWTEAGFRLALAQRPGGVVVLRAPDRGGEPARGILAYCVFQAVTDELHIHDLVVHPVYRRRGLGRRLMRLILGLGRRHGARSAFLEVRPSNLAAIALYRSLGFRTVGLRRGYYAQPPEDALVLRRDGPEED